VSDVDVRDQDIAAITAGCATGGGHLVMANIAAAGPLRACSADGIRCMPVRARRFTWCVTSECDNCPHEMPRPLDLGNAPRPHPPLESPDGGAGGAGQAYRVVGGQATQPLRCDRQQLAWTNRLTQAGIRSPEKKPRFTTHSITTLWSPGQKLGCYGLERTSATIVAHFLRV
jgi:hypothetical protein